MSLITQPFNGLAYRAHHPMWSYTPLSGEGAKRHGGRFNSPGCATLYLALDPTTAWMEAQQGFPFKPQPMTLVAYQTQAIKLVDLNDLSVLQTLGWTAQDLACSWEDLAAQGIQPPTWRLAEQLLKLNVAGARVRSFAPGCDARNQNLVLWQWADTVQVIDDFGRLPKSAQSWNPTSADQ